MSTFALVNCSELVTLAGPARPRVRTEMRDLAVIRDGAMVVRDGVIEQVGRRAEMTLPPKTIDAGGNAVMPGFVDAHTHPVFAGNRADEFEARAGGATYQQIAAAGGGIRSTVRKTRAATEDELMRAASRSVNWFLRCGTTTIEAKSGYGLTLADELKMLRVIHRMGTLRAIPTFLGAHEVPDEYRGRREEYIDLVIHEMLPAARKLAGYCDIFCEPHVFPVADARRILSAAKEHGFKLRMHVDQLQDSGGAQLAAELGAVTADHLEYTETPGITAMLDRGVQPVLLPGSVYALGSKRYPDARAMIDAGLGVVLATDFNPGSSPTPSIPMICSLACTQMKMTPAESITAATINAAYSLQCGHQIGSLEAGKRADFVIHDYTDHRELPYFFGIPSALAVFVGGQRVV
ncbi:MAG TPA: imidazolonepropionase [Bryobacteraceae bacterium]|nr:imidazolonepropionase [Bryobacteraceae bacterium]